MKAKFILPFIFSASILSACTGEKPGDNGQAIPNPSDETGKEPWRSDQLMDPSTLAQLINDSAAPKPVIYCIGPGGDIKGRTDLGSAQEKENLDKLKSALGKLDKDTAIVIYCGCCPFEHCPNIRPAFALLNEMNFTNHKLLNLPHNIKVDWIDKGYPMEK